MSTDTVDPTQENSSQLLAAIVESSGDAIIGCTLDGRITSWNKGAEHIFGYEAAEVIGKPIALLHPAGNHEEQRAILANIRSGRSVTHYETARLHKDGHGLIVSLSVSSIRDRAGNIVGASKIYRDITAQKEADRVLRNAEKLAVANRLAASVAHEINNPLAAIVNLHYLLRNEPLTEKARSYLEAAERELTRVTQVTTQALGFYQENAPMRPVCPSDEVESALAIQSSRIENKAIEVKREYRDHAIECRAGELRQAIVNLIGNALDAMPDGARLRLRSRNAHDVRSGREGVRITVADNGSGISSESRRRLFEPFNTSRGAMRTGLGLWMCNQIVLRHRGHMRIHSGCRNQCCGTVVSIFLPQAAPA